MDEFDIAAQITHLLKEAKEKNLVIIKQEMLNELAKERRERAEFEERLYLRWKKPLDLFETIMLLGRQSGSEFNQQVRPFASKQQDFVFEVLTRIHARACSVMSATLTLLKSGFAGDALARARTLHELDITIQFILKQKDSNQLAEKYLLYQIVETLQTARQYEKHYSRLGHEPITPETIPNLERQVTLYRKKFGKEYSQVVTRGSYGWAAEIFKLTRKPPTFDMIEEAVGFAHMRPYYKLASEAIHASPKGIMFDVGNLDRNLLPAGPSNAGLADPGSMALNAFHRCTAHLLLYQRYFDEPSLREIHLQSLVACQVMQELLEEANQSFLEAHQQLMREEMERQTFEET
jgi:hypothetical protein